MGIDLIAQEWVSLEGTNRYSIIVRNLDGRRWTKLDVVIGLSRRKLGFDSPWERQQIQILTRYIERLWVVAQGVV
jgi:hypothetical protein